MDGMGAETGWFPPFSAFAPGVCRAGSVWHGGAVPVAGPLQSIAHPVVRVAEWGIRQA